MRIFWMYTGSDGESHLEQIQPEFHPMAYGESIDIAPIKSAHIVKHGPSPGSATLEQFHNAPQRQLIIQLSGSGEVDCGNGETCMLGQGDVLFVEDEQGKGHISRAVDVPREQLWVQLSDDFDVRSLL